MLLHLVADFGTGDLAFAEVTQRLALHLPEARVLPTAVPPFADLCAGFVVTQLAAGEGPAERAVFCNVAPRRDRSGARQDGDGEGLLHALLPNGVRVVFTHAGAIASFLADAGADVRSLSGATAGSQFRSRDLFPKQVAAALRGEGLGAPLDTATLAPLPRDRLAYVDGFGNLKTTIDAADAPPPGTEVRVAIGGAVRTAVRADGAFAVPEGVLAFAPGSSGWPRPDRPARRFMELFLRGGDASERFGRPPVGSTVQVRAVAG